MASTSKQSASDGANAPLVTALGRLLRPLVRLLVARGITYGFLTDLLKRLYVDIANRDFAEEGRAQTVSRVSVLSGVHRKDVRRLLDEEETVADVPRAVSLGARLVSTWVSERRYLDASGKPRRLPRVASGSRKVSFESLVEEVHRQDVRPRVVLDELLRLGVVDVDDDTVALKAEALVPTGNFEELAYYFGRNLRDHIAAAARNVSGTQPAYPERAAYHDGLSHASVDKLRKLAATKSMDVLRELNKEAAKLSKKDVAAGESGQRVTVGFYFWGGPDDEDESQS